MGSLGLLDDDDDPLSNTEGRPRKLVDMENKGIVDVIAGGLSSMAIGVDEAGKQTLFTWGCNDHGCLGRSKDKKDYLPYPAEGLDGVDKIVQVVSGDNVSLVLTEFGEVYGTGTWRDANGIYGFLEPGEITSTFTKIPGLSNIISIAIGNNHATAVDASGKVSSWVIGEHGALGRRIIGRHKGAASLLPRRVNWNRQVRFSAVYSGGDHTFLVSGDRTKLYAFGLNGYGQLGVGDVEDFYETPLEVDELPAGVKIKMCAAGEFHSMVLLEDGRLFAFGRNDDFQCGVASRPFSYIDKYNAPKTSVILVPTPTHVDGFGGEAVSFVACGSRYTVAITGSGKLFGWGLNQLGNLGTRDEETREVPTHIPLQDRRALAVACGGNHAIWLLGERPGQDPVGLAVVPSRAASVDGDALEGSAGSEEDQSAPVVPSMVEAQADTASESGEGLRKKPRAARKG
ncbi:RCC1/BLIP-II protein [Gonapodya prolifera JEL478]|uniref:RCC1/BLIP-II protein n=1 Tax=Gonapodya prolifera (strain JEL478) TaxID=1344416 RepID=A0A139AG06_GONPJ|nr:RCC1/BLIP-II protein [Gonapodya prolifera JEL478]|eukprot:KXS15343.1 RCC1/BLIP-II protein [Gonapodya prolifera JEL478]